MIGTRDSKTLRRLGGVILACAGAWCGAGEIQPIAVVRSLPVAELATNPPVRIRGVVTLRSDEHVVIQDDTAGI